MWNKLRLNNTYLMIIAGLILFIFIGLVEKKQRSRNLNDVVIEIKHEYDNFFIDRAEIHKLINDQSEEQLLDFSVKNINLKAIEERIKSNKFVKSVDVYKDLKGSLIISISQRRPIARIIRKTGPDAYIGENGVILPTSEEFTARVVLVSGKIVDNLIENDLESGDQNATLLDVLKYIDADPFWKAQIAQIELNEDNEMIMYPQVGKQTITFGTPDNFEKKFRNLKVFFTRVLPEKGWNEYENVNIKYNNQIVCE